MPHTSFLICEENKDKSHGMNLFGKLFEMIHIGHLEHVLHYSHVIFLLLLCIIIS